MSFSISSHFGMSVFMMVVRTVRVSVGMTKFSVGGMTSTVHVTVIVSINTIVICDYIFILVNKMVGDV